MERVLVTGASGHVGANLLPLLVRQGYRIRVLDFDRDHRAYQSIPVQIIRGSILDDVVLDEAMNDVQVLIHSAAFISLDRKDAKMIRMVNVEGTRKVCKAALKHKVKKMIHFSSVDCFERAPFHQPLHEERPLVTSSHGVPYDISKAEGQRIVLQFCEKGLNASILQPTAILGPNDFKKGLLSKELSAVANGERKYNICYSYNFVDVRDLCETTINCIKNGRKGQNYIVGGHLFDTYEINRIISSELNGRETLKLIVPFFSSYLALPFFFLASKLLNHDPIFTWDTLHTISYKSSEIPSSLAKYELSHNPRSHEETLRDALKFYISQGWVKSEEE